MRLESQPNDGEDPTQSTDIDPNQQVQDSDPNQDPNQQTQEPTLPEGVDLGAIYDTATGQPLYEDEEGVPCDIDGNPVPVTMPGFQAAPPTETPEIPPVPQARTFTSPLAEGLLSEEERQDAETVLDPKALKLVETIASRMADRIVAAKEQQRAAARDVGITEEILDKYAPAMSRLEAYVPAHLRGTKEGAITNFMLAVTEEAAVSGDPLGTLARLLPKEAPTNQPPVNTAIPPGARMTNPRPSPDPTVTRKISTVRDAANESFKKDGIEGNVIALLQKERKERVA